MSEDMATDHVNGNGTEEPMDTTAAVTRSEHFPALLEAGLPQKVAEKLDELYVAGKHASLSVYLCVTAVLTGSSVIVSRPGLKGPVRLNGIVVSVQSLCKSRFIIRDYFQL